MNTLKSPPSNDLSAARRGAGAAFTAYVLWGTLPIYWKMLEGIPVVAGVQALVLDDWDAMIAAVIDLWEHPEKADKLAREGRKLAAGLDWNVVAEKYLSIYSALP